MENVKNYIATLPTTVVDGKSYLSCQAVTETVAAYLYPDGITTYPATQIDEAGYQHILETADTLCRELGYTQVVKLTPLHVPVNQMGLYWTKERPGESTSAVFIAGPGRVEALEDNHLVDARLNHLRPDEVTRQHFKIPVQLFEPGHVVMTAGAAALNVDFVPYLARHLSGDWGSLDAFDVRQNNQAIREGLRILSAYDVPVNGGETERIWIITEWDRSSTTVLTPAEY